MDASWSSFCLNYKSVLPLSIPSLAVCPLPPKKEFKGTEGELAVKKAQKSNIPRVLASFHPRRGFSLVLSCWDPADSVCSAQLKPILRMKEGWGQRLCVGGFLLCWWVTRSLRRGRKCALRSEHSQPWLGASLIIHRTDVIESQEFSELERT